MADLTGKEASQSVIVSGANPSTGVETNYMDVDSNGNAKAKIHGGTDNTPIGNEGDYLKVSSAANEEETYTVYSADTALATNKSMLSIMNGSGSTKVVKIRELRIINVQTANISGIISDMAVFRITSHTGGTDLPVQTHDTADSLDSNITCKTNATVGGEAAVFLRRWLFDADEISQGGLNSDTFQSTLAGFNPYLTKNDPQAKAITLRPGEGLHIKQRTATTVGSFDIMIMFTEEPA